MATGYQLCTPYLQEVRNNPHKSCPVSQTQLISTLVSHVMGTSNSSKTQLSHQQEVITLLPTSWQIICTHCKPSSILVFARQDWLSTQYPLFQTGQVTVKRDVTLGVHVSVKGEAAARAFTH